MSRKVLADMPVPVLQKIAPTTTGRIILRESAPDGNGYPRVLAFENGRLCSLYVHRIVVEDRIGRKLRSDEIVHHRNGDKTDNSESNILILTRSEHARIHRLTRSKIDRLRAKASREPFRGSTGHHAHNARAGRQGSPVLAGSVT